MLNQWTSIIEGLLFMIGDDGLSIAQLTQVLAINEEDVVACLDELKREYTSAKRGIELVCFGEQYKLITKASVHEYGMKLFELPERSKLSPALLETLAIIAYKQPITRAEIEEIRGVGCDYSIRRLLAMALIKEAGRSEAVGRPSLFEVTEEFMDAFKLKSINELPDLPQLHEEQEMDLFQNMD